ncbi:MAG: ABC transporter substrate-binding protein [Verrucomicrobiota bacterium]
MRGLLHSIKYIWFVLLFVVFAAIFLAPDRIRNPETVIYATYGDVKDWDPAVAFSLEVMVLANIYEPLVYYDPSGGDEPLKPALAEKWFVSEDGLKWTFHLREGVRFHDGSLLTAEAAKQSLERTIKLGKGGSYIWSSVESITAVDELTLEIRTEYPAPIDLIASSQYAAYIYSPEAAKHDSNWFNEGHAAGTGPYRLRQWERNQQIVLEQNADYWGGWQDGQITRVIYKIVRESATQVQLLLAGEADFLSLVSVDLLDTFEANPDIRVAYIPSWKNSQFLINTRKGPTRDPDFRRALVHAWDYETVVSKVYAGSADVARGIIPRSLWGHDAGLPSPAFDLTKAKNYLDLSGIPLPERKVSIAYIASSAAYQSAVELYQSNLAKIGIEAELKPGPWGSIWDNAKNLETAPNLISMTWWPTYATPSDWLTGLFKTEEPANFNLSYYSNPDYDVLVAEGVRLEAADRPAAVERYHKAQRILIEDAVAVFYADLKERVIHRADLQGVDPNPAYNTIFFHQLRRGKEL